MQMAVHARREKGTLPAQYGALAPVLRVGLRPLDAPDGHHAWREAGDYGG
jgi:hypothetical protein